MQAALLASLLRLPAIKPTSRLADAIAAYLHPLHSDEFVMSPGTAHGFAPVPVDLKSLPLSPTHEPSWILKYEEHAVRI